MKKEMLVIILSFYLIASSAFISAAECDNLIDDDGDGKIDFLVELDPNNKETLRVNTDPFGDISTSTIDGVMEAVAKNISNKKLPYSLTWITGHAVLRKAGSTTHTATLNKVCNVLGYASVKSHSCISPPYENRCNFVSPGDNYLWIFDSAINNFKAISASDNEWISDITCETRLSACNDGWDNDGDGKTDFCLSDGSNSATCDTGCSSPNDDSEVPHDPECSSLNDNSEKDSDLQCSNGIDDDGDGLTDYPNDLGCCSAVDTIETDGLPQCSDGCDNDGDKLTDFSTPLVANYSFNGNADDSSGNGNNGVVNGPVLVTGKINQAYSFDGVDDYISITNETPFDFDKNDKFSLALWLKPDATDTSTQVPISKMRNAAPYVGWNLVINYGGSSNVPGKIDVQMLNTLSNRIEIASSDVTKLNDDNWHHYVITYNGSSLANGVKIYEDGLELPLTIAKDTLTTSILNDYKVTIGDREGGNTGFSYKGLIDEAKVWKRVLNSVEVTNEFSFGTIKDPECSDPNWNNESSPPGFLNESYWSNMLDQPINRSDLRDSVKLIIGGDFLAGKNVEYEIYKEVKWWFDTKVNSGRTKGFYVWKAGEKQNDMNFSEGNYYFKARIGNKEVDSHYLTDGSDNPYGILNVSGTANDPPIAIISVPENRQIYFKDEILSFTALVQDPDDEVISYKWVLGEGTEVRQGNVNSGDNINFNYSYPTIGQKNTILEIDDKRTNGFVKYRLSILMIDSITSDKYVFSYVDKPLWGTFISGRDIDFEAFGTYGVEKKSDGNISCLSGFCPTETKGCPLGSTEPQPDCRLQLQDYPNNTNDANYDLITFVWEFNGPRSYKETCSEADGCGVNFSKLFTVPGEYYTVLNSSINPSSTYTTYFNTHFEESTPVCVIIQSDDEYPGIDKGNYWKYPDSIPLDSSNDCYKSDGIDWLSREPKQQCCIAGYTCVDSQCIYSGKEDCNDFLTESECNADNGHSEIAKDDLQNGNNPPVQCGFDIKLHGSCFYRNSCKCEWKNNKCDAVGKSIYETIQTNPDGTPLKKWVMSGTLTSTEKASIEVEINKTCVLTQEEITFAECILERSEVLNECGGNTRFKTIKDYYVFNGDNDDNFNELYNCQDQVREIPCSNIIRLNFFGIWNLIAVILILFVIYFIYLRMRIKKKKSRKSKRR